MGVHRRFEADKVPPRFKSVLFFSFFLLPPGSHFFSGLLAHDHEVPRVSSCSLPREACPSPPLSTASPCPLLSAVPYFQGAPSLGNSFFPFSLFSTISKALFSCPPPLKRPFPPPVPIRTSAVHIPDHIRPHSYFPSPPPPGGSCVSFSNSYLIPLHSQGVLVIVHSRFLTQRPIFASRGNSPFSLSFSGTQPATVSFPAKKGYWETPPVKLPFLSLYSFSILVTLRPSLKSKHRFSPFRESDLTSSEGSSFRFHLKSSPFLFLFCGLVPPPLRQG